MFMSFEDDKITKGGIEIKMIINKNKIIEEENEKIKKEMEKKYKKQIERYKKIFKW